MNITVIIPSYKNTQMLLKNLKHNIHFLKGCEIIIVNDDPDSKDSLNAVSQNFSDIKIIHNKINLGFGDTVNNGIKNASGDYFMLLNSDVILHKDSFKYAFKHFEKNSKLFAVSFAQMERDGTIVGKNAFYWKHGFFHHKSIKITDTKTMTKNGWAEGGSCIIDAKKFNELGGFDPLYAPFYWEDIDLSYRAWKTGYEVFFDPSIEVEHHHESTIRKYFNKQKIKTIAYRNQLIFIWKNITDNDLMEDHNNILVSQFFKSIFKADFAYVRGHLNALARINAIKTKRYKSTKTDKEIINIFRNSL